MYLYLNEDEARILRETLDAVEDSAVIVAHIAHGLGMSSVSLRIVLSRILQRINPAPPFRGKPKPKMPVW